MLHLIEQVLALSLRQQLLGLADHVQVDGHHGQLRLGLGVLSFGFAQRLSAAQEAHVGQRHLQHAHAALLNGHLRHLLLDHAVVDQLDGLVRLVQFAASQVLSEVHQRIFQVLIDFRVNVLLVVHMLLHLLQGCD
jgi:hypothetical protein